MRQHTRIPADVIELSALNLTFRKLGGEAESLEDSIQQSGCNWDDFTGLPGHREIRRRPQHAADSDDGVTERWLRHAASRCAIRTQCLRGVARQAIGPHSDQ